MKVLHVLDHSIPLHSGYTFRTRAIIREQRLRGWQTFHVTGVKQGGAPDLLEEQVDGLLFYRTPPSAPSPTRLAGIASWVAQWQGIRLLRQRLTALVPSLKPDVIHVHSPALNGLAALPVAREFGIPLVYEVRAFWEDAAADHGTCAEGDWRYRLTRAMESYVLRRANHVTTICQGLQDDIIDRGIADEKVTVIPNAVDIDNFPRLTTPDLTLKRQLGLEHNRIIGFIGSFYGYEGLSLIIDALPLIREKLPDVKLLLVGGGLQERNLKQQVAALGLGDQVVFAGRVAHDEVARYYSLVDLLIYPRLSKRITELVTPLKPLEAMAQGKAFICSDVGGHQELAGYSQGQLLFTAGSASALAGKTITMLNNPRVRDVLIDNGREFVEQERNWQRSVARYAGIYERICHRRSPRGPAPARQREPMK